LQPYPRNDKENNSERNTKAHPRGKVYWQFLDIMGSIQPENKYNNKQT